jgi:Secretion system C-terminal sorting domain
VPTMTTWSAPQIVVTPDSMYCPLMPNTSHTDSVMIFNTTTGNSTLDYEIELTNNTFPGQIITRVVQIIKSNTTTATKENPDLMKGSSIMGSGGPDLFGYEWIDSNDPQGPVYEWNDIVGTGTQVTNWIPTSIYSGEDEGKAGPFDLGFTFKYYGVTYNNVWFCSNGFISFVDITDAAMSNGTIPSSNIPNNFIAGIWDDLDGKTTGKVYYKQEPTKFIVQYNNWPGYSTGVGPFTFQFVIHKNGKIMLYFKTITGTSTSATVGIENHNGTDGLQVAYNATYLQNNLALQFSAEPEWLLAENIQGTVYNGNSIAILLDFVTEGLDSGDYSMDMVITSNDPLHSEIIVPIAMKITSIVPVELSSFTAENVDGEVVLKWQTATETNNMGFEVERSQKSNVKSQNEWSKISFVEGRGTTTEITDYNYKDKITNPGKYVYRLKQIDFDGTVSYSEEIEIDVPGPKEFTLYQNYPNPFNPTTTIKFALPVDSKVKINVYNTVGQLVETLVDKEMESGYHEVSFDASRLASGVYLYQLQAKDYVSVKKMLLIK